MVNSVQKFVSSLLVYGTNQILWSIEVVKLTITKNLKGNKINLIHFEAKNIHLHFQYG
jgi:hypothetical protein